MTKLKSLPNDKASITSSWTLDMYPIEATMMPADKNGEIMVTVNGSPPIPVRNFSGVPRKVLMELQYTGRPVLLSPINGNPCNPAVTSIEDSLLEEIMIKEVKKKGKHLQLIHQIDGKDVVIEAENQIIFKCGKGCIIIRNNGLIEIYGTDILNLSKGSLRLRGSNVDVN